MERWIFLSGPRMGSTTLLNDVKRGNKAAALKESLGIKRHSRIAVTHCHRTYTNQVEGIVENAHYWLHDWAAHDDPKIMQEGDRVIALHLSIPEWGRRYASAMASHEIHGLTLPVIRWYYHQLASWDVSRTDLHKVVPIEHWDMETGKFFKL